MNAVFKRNYYCIRQKFKFSLDCCIDSGRIHRRHSITICRFWSIVIEYYRFPVDQGRKKSSSFVTTAQYPVLYIPYLICYHQYLASLVNLAKQFYSQGVLSTARGPGRLHGALLRARDRTRQRNPVRSHPENLRTAVIAKYGGPCNVRKTGVEDCGRLRETTG